MNLIREFKTFAMRGNVVDMAIGVVIGTAFGKIVSSLVSDIIMPPIGLITGGVDFSRLALTLRKANDGVNAVTLNYGIFFNTIIDFLIISFSIFFVIRAMNRVKRREPALEQTQKTCSECTMLIPLSAKRCPHCTAVLHTS